MPSLRRILYALLWSVTPGWVPWGPMRKADEFERDSDRRLRTMAVTEIELAGGDEYSVAARARRTRR